MFANWPSIPKRPKILFLFCRVVSMCSEDKTFYYSEKDFVYTTSWQEGSNLSKFDELVNNYWRNAMENNYFRFKLNIQKTKQLKGRFGLVAQLNTDRGLKRRQPHNIQTMDDPFNPDTFNFTHIPDKEIISKLKGWQEGENSRGEDLIAINVSPLAVSHCLILPQVDLQLSQILTLHAAELALHILLLSADPSLRIGFNSLCGFASVNHLHLHTFLLPQKMFLETIPLKPLAGPCYQVDDYAIKGFAFEQQLQCCDDITTLARNTHKLTSFLQDRKIAHNVNWTRSGDRDADSERKKVRVYVWAREYSVVKLTTAFNPALCEFFGLLDFRTEEEYETATEEAVCRALEKQTSSSFADVRAAVCHLFSQSNA